MSLTRKDVGKEALLSLYRATVSEMDRQQYYHTSNSYNTMSGDSYNEQVYAEHLYNITLSQRDIELLTDHLGLLHGNEDFTTTMPTKPVHLSYTRQMLDELYKTKKQNQKEYDIARSHPQLKKAWNHYQTLKKMLNDPDK